jgi:hypothetical protein
MSKHAVSFLINTLLVDPDLWERFAASPVDVLIDLRLSADIELGLEDVGPLLRAGHEILTAETGPRIH